MWNDLQQNDNFFWNFKTLKPLLKNNPDHPNKAGPNLLRNNLFTTRLLHTRHMYVYMPDGPVFKKLGN